MGIYRFGLVGLVALCACSAQPDYKTPSDKDSGAADVAPLPDEAETIVDVDSASTSADGGEPTQVGACDSTGELERCYRHAHQQCNGTEWRHTMRQDCCVAPRQFVPSGEGIVADAYTTNEWLVRPPLDANGHAICESQKVAGGRWRTPTIEELMTLTLTRLIDNDGKVLCQPNLDQSIFTQVTKTEPFLAASDGWFDTVRMVSGTADYPSNAKEVCVRTKG